MNKYELNNYINLCKKYDLYTINNICNDLNIKTNEQINYEYGIPLEYINSIKIISQNGINNDRLKDIYNEYHKMIGGKGGKGKGKGTKGSKNSSVKQIQRQSKKKKKKKKNT